METTYNFIDMHREDILNVLIIVAAFCVIFIIVVMAFLLLHAGKKTKATVAQNAESEVTGGKKRIPVRSVKDVLDRYNNYAVVATLIVVISFPIMDVIQKGYVTIVTIVVDALIVLILAHFYLVRPKKKKAAVAQDAEPFDSTEEIPLINSEDQIAEATEEEEAIIDPESYAVDEDDENLFHSLANNDFSIRIIKTGGKERDRDQLIFAFSLPHKFDSGRKKAMLASIPQLTDIDLSKTHELFVFKSAAVKFADLQDTILQFLFFHLYLEYDWMSEAQEVLIETVPNPNRLNFNLRVETCRHIELARKLMALPGIEGEAGGLPTCMEHQGHYDFSLGKAKLYNWDELLPKIKEVFTDYFKEGVKFLEDFSDD